MSSLRRLPPASSPRGGGRALVRQAPGDPGPGFRGVNVMPGSGRKIGSCVRCGGELPPHRRGRRRKFCRPCVAAGAYAEGRRKGRRSGLCVDCGEAYVAGKRGPIGKRCAGRRERWRRFGRHAERRRRVAETAAADAAVWRDQHLAALREQYRRCQLATISRLQRIPDLSGSESSS